MPVVRSIIPYRKSRRLRKTEPKDYGQDDDLWEPYDEAMLAPSPTVPVKSEPDAPLDVLIPDLGQSVHIPRPRNAFIFFRSDYVKAEKRVASRPGSLDQTVLSRGAGDVWREMSEDERLPYVLMAQQEKEDHALKYPNYRYAPGSANGVARKNKKPKPAALRRASTATSDSSDVRARSPYPTVVLRASTRPTLPHRGAGSPLPLLLDVLASLPQLHPSRPRRPSSLLQRSLRLPLL
ncbi:hypothetical protein B0H13DRAFT_631639 [Mycena leptocephala]|nr:hypothetical protein B0H13DRAFT_631639 [Mycena leptocephala]